LPLVTAPSTSEIRDDLAAYLDAIRAGQTFFVHHYSTPIGKFGPISELPSQYEERARTATFTEVRDESSLIRRRLMNGTALVVTRRRSRTSNSGRGRRSTSGLLEAERVAAFWPLPEGGAVSAVSSEVRDLIDEVQSLKRKVGKHTEAIQLLVEGAGPLLKRLAEARILDAEIDEKQKQLANLDSTYQRILGEVKRLGVLPKT